MLLFVGVMRDEGGVGGLGGNVFVDFGESATFRWMGWMMIKCGVRVIGAVGSKHVCYSRRGRTRQLAG